MVFANTLALQIGWLEVGLALSLLLLYSYYSWTSAYSYWKRRNVPFLKPTFPFGNFANVLLLKKNFPDSWMHIYNEMGNRPFCGIYSIKTPVLVVKDPELIKSILVKNFSHFTDHGWFSNPQHEPLLNNLFHMEGEIWKNMRSILSPAFSSGKMKMMYPIMNGCARNLEISLDYICKETGTFEAKDLMSRYTVDTIINSVFGLNATSVVNPDCNFYKTGRKIFGRSFTRMFSSILLLQAPKIYKLLKLHFVDYQACQYFADLIKHIIKDREDNHITRNDFVDILVRLKNNLSIEDEDMFSTDANKRLANDVKEMKEPVSDVNLNDLLAQALTFFFAGFETSASALSFSLYELSSRPDLQLKIQKEVDTALERHGGAFTYELMEELPCIDNVIRETLRRYSALSALDRVCVKAYKIPGTDIVIEKGCKVSIPSYAIHHDPKYYPDPFTFDPDRFLEENIKSKSSYTYLPFGEGPRICLGMRFARMTMRLALATFFSQYNCKMNPVTPVPLTIACGEILTTTKDNILIDIVRKS